MKKRILSMVLTMSLAFSMIATSALAADGHEHDETCGYNDGQCVYELYETGEDEDLIEAEADGEIEISTEEITGSQENPDTEIPEETEDVTEESSSEEDVAMPLESEEATPLLGSSFSVAETETDEESETLCDHGNDAESCAVCNLEEQIAALPTLEEIQIMTGDEEETVYAQASALADVYYDDLTEDEQAQVSNIDTLWDILDYFSSGLTLTALSVDTTWYNDTDTSFTLYDAADLAGLASLVNAGNDFDGKTIILGNSINLNSEAWTPIGTSESYSFKGTFDGKGYTILNLSVSGTNNLGLFGCATGSAVIKNVTVTGSVSGSSYNCGGIAGYIGSSVTIENCTNSTTVSATVNIGGIVGQNTGTVKNCYNSGSITGIGSVGGVVGINSGSVKNCCNSGTVTSTYTGYDYAGGVVGQNWGSVTNCCNYGSVSGYTGIGGVVGYNGNSVTNCYNYGTVSGTTNVGGVVGNNSSSSNPTNCYYLTGTATAGIGSDSGSTSVAAKTTTQFASGEVTYLLNSGTTDGTQTWYQTLGTDSYPVLDSTHGTVYYTTVGCDGSSVTGTYSNSSVIHAGSNYDNGFCTNCGAYQPATLNGSTYEISNAGQLFWFASLVSGDTTQEGITAANTGASAVLTADITIPSGYEWTPIGTKGAPYTGTFDGDGYTVSGMSITTASTYMGLFGYVSAGTIKDLAVSGAINVSGNSLYAGGIVGTVSNGTLSNLTSNVSVTAYDGKKGTFGGVAATVESGSTMEFCVNKGTVNANGVLDCVGGLVGYMNSATITNCANYGMVDTSGGTAASSDGIYTGGIVGYINNASANVTNCFNVGTISGADSSSIVSYTGAIVGRINQYVKEVSNCYYLSSDSSTLAGVGANGSGVTVEPTAKTSAEFASGEVAYLLNGSVSAGTTWYQIIDSGTTDSYPVLDSSHGAVYYGTNCAGTAIYSNSTVPAATHSLTHVETQGATCTETGNNEYWYCSVCDGYFSDAGALGTTSLSEVTIPAKGHSWGATVYTWSDDGKSCTATRTCETDSSHVEESTATVTGAETKAATCTEDGEITYTGSFSVDWAEQRTQVGIISATGHSYEAVVTEPTCTTGGYTTYICSVCGESYTADETEATGHNYESVVTEPTCTEKGYTTYTCSACGDSYVADETEATGHSWDEGTVTTEATCTKDGEKTYTCKVCGETKTEKIEAAGHSYEAVVTEPTCTAGGYTTYTCSVCGDSYTADETEAKGHSYEAVITDATYTAQGYTTYTCTVCGESYEADYTAVKVINETDGNLSTKTTVQELTSVPDGLKNQYSSVDALVSDLIKRVVAVGTGYTEDNALVYDVVLQYSTDGGKTWITATVDSVSLL